MRLPTNEGGIGIEVQQLIDAAVMEIELLAEIALSPQLITVTLDLWPPGGVVRLPIGPVLPSALYCATIGTAELTILSLRYGRTPAFTLDAAEWRSGQIEVTHTAGFESVPQDLRLAILDQALVYYDARGDDGCKQPALSPHTARDRRPLSEVRL